MKRMIAVHKHLEGMKKHEELVGEIYEELSRFAGHIIRYQADGDRHAEHECKMVFANNIIALCKEEEVLEATDIPRYCEHCGSEEHYTSEHY